MKKCLLVILFPLFSLADTCEELKIQVLENISSSETSLSENSSYIYIAKGDVSAIRNYGSSYLGSTILQALDYIDECLDLISANESTISNNLTSARSLVQSIDCSCDENGTCPCDFSEIIELLTSIEGYSFDSYLELVTHQNTLLDIYDKLTDIQDLVSSGFVSVTNQLFYNNFLLEHGLHDITNLINRALFYNFDRDENLLIPSDDLWWYQTQQDRRRQEASFYVQEDAGLIALINALYYNNYQALASLNNYQYFFTQNYFPRFSNQVTNTLVAIHRDQTNYFSFFRGELGVQGVLSDWQSEQVSGSYHDFLTNHYLTVVRGGSLSGNQAAKTNWFSRIETLLAALVFTDSAETNTVDTSAGQQERQKLETSYETANQVAANFSDDFKSTSQSIVTLYQNYFSTFENASMPSHVVLMRLSNSNPSEQVEISFQSDSLGILVESCRVVTTLCWSSVGIFLLYKFLVWSARRVILACQFIYRAISSVFR